MRRLLHAAESILKGTEAAAAICLLALVLITFSTVVVRYLFSVSAMALQELQWYCYALSFLFGMAPTFRAQGHVRIDILYARLPATWRRRIDIWGTLLFLLPFAGLILWASYDFVAYSYSIREASPNPGGLPAVYLFKAAIPLSFALLVLAAAVMLWHWWQGRETDTRAQERL